LAYTMLILILLLQKSDVSLEKGTRKLREYVSPFCC
jgi:hypothetical protein